MNSPDSKQFSALVDRLVVGDERAREIARAELIAAAMNRLERLARKMLSQFPGVKRWEETGDVLNNALIRLDRALRAIPPESTRQFFGLAAEQMRRELLDLADHYYGPLGQGRNHQSGVRPGDPGSGGMDPVDVSPTQDELDRWAAFHQAVERLPAEEREVFMLTFYHQWTQTQIATLLGETDRNVRRRLAAAKVQLHTALGGELPHIERNVE